MMRLCVLLLAALLALGSGCSRKCEGLAPQVEITLNPGAVTRVGEIKSFLIRARLDPGPWKSLALSRKEAGLEIGSTGKFKIDFDNQAITAGQSLWLQVFACAGLKSTCQQQGAIASSKTSSHALEPNACNFFSVSLTDGTVNVLDGGVDGGDAFKGPRTIVVSQANIQVTGKADGDQLSNMVACDLDGDGKDDLALAAPYAQGKNNKGVTRGRVYLLLSKLKLSPLKANTDTLSFDLNITDADGTIYGAEDVDHLGASLACGKLDDNEYEDLVIGAPDAKGGRGKVYVLFGSTGLSQLSVDLEKQSLDVEIIGGAVGDHLGKSLAVVRFDESKTGSIIPGYLAMGAPGYSGGLPPGPSDAGATDAGATDSGLDAAGPVDAGTKARANAGAVFMLPHGALKKNPTYDLAQPTQMVVLLGGMSGEQLGTSLAVGDLNNDKREDLAAGGPGAIDSSSVARGVVRVLGGDRVKCGEFRRFDCAKGSGEPHSLDVWGYEDKSGFGKSVAIGNIDTSVPDDLVVGAPMKNKAYVFVGDASTLLPASPGGPGQRQASEVTTPDIDKHSKARFEGTSFFASSLATMKRSTNADLVVGAPGSSSAPGMVYWLRRAQGFGLGEVVKVEQSADVVLKVVGATAGDGLGTAVAGGVINDGDTEPDILMSAPQAGASGRVNLGRIYGVLYQWGK